MPFVGAGLASQAGAPSSDDLAASLAERAGVPVDSLSEVTRNTEEAHSVAWVQETVAEVFQALRLRPTPVLRAIAANPSRRVLTTNYDDAIGQAALAVGRTPIPLQYTDARALDEDRQAVRCDGSAGTTTWAAYPRRRACSRSTMQGDPAARDTQRG